MSNEQPYQRPQVENIDTSVSELTSVEESGVQPQGITGQTVTPDQFQQAAQKLNAPAEQEVTSTTTSLTAKSPTASLVPTASSRLPSVPSSQPLAEDEEEIIISLPHPAEIINARHVKNVGDFFFFWLGLCTGNGGQVITSSTTALVALYQNPVNFLPSTTNPIVAFFGYLLIRLLVAFVIAAFFQSVVALLMIFFIDNLVKILNLDNANPVITFLVMGGFIIVTLFTVGANFYSDATVMRFITTSVLIIGLVTGILTICSVGFYYVGRLMRSYGKAKLDYLYGQVIQYYEYNNMKLPADAQAYLNFEKKVEEARGLKRWYYSTFA